MSDKKTYYKETVERYCHIVGKNMKFNLLSNGSERHFQCMGCDECSKNGGCKHHVFSKSTFNMTKK